MYIAQNRIIKTPKDGNLAVSGVAAMARAAAKSKLEITVEITVRTA